jgi:PKD repeat protein
MRWTALAIPPGATITAAWVQFAAKAAQSEATTLTLRGQAADNPPAFTTTAGNISTRPRTAAATAWAPVAWLAGEAGPNQRTPDLSAVIQEIVGRPGWASGNALALIVTGTGHRTAYSWDGKAAGAPLLHVEYTTGPVTEAPPVARLTVSQLASPALTVLADGSTSTDVDATPIASYRFTFGDGSAAVTTSAPTATAQHTYTTSGSYTVTLVCTDTGGNASAPATTTVNVLPPGGTTVAVYTGYYDTHHPGLPKPKPNPWMGSPNTVFVGQPDNPNSSTLDWDSSALRVENLSGGTLSGVVVTADIGSKHFALWGTNTIPAGWNLVLAQTAFENFDGSDLNAAGCYDCNPNDCLTKVSSVIPIVRVTIGGTTTTYYDIGQQLNTNGVDMAGCPYTGERNDESENWERVYPQLPGNYVVQRDATGEVTLVTSPERELWLATPFPNPSHGRLVFSFRTGSTGEVKLGVYDLAGRLVRQSLDAILEAGEYRNAMDLSGLAAGGYFCRLTTAEGSLHKTFMLVH